MLAVSVLTASLVWAGFLTSPSPAYAGNAASLPPVAHTVIFTDGERTASISSKAATVGEFLREHGIRPGENDALAPSIDTPISDKMTVVYRQAIPVTIVMENRRETLLTSAPDVATLLVSQNIHLGMQDSIEPALDSAPPVNGVVRITRVIAWQRIVRRKIAMRTIEKLDFSLAPGVRRVVAKGASGMREELVSFVQRDGGPIDAHVLHARTIRKAHPRVIDVGVTEMQAYEHFANESVHQAGLEMKSTLQMIATAYTAGCAGCSGITATGRPAGHGVVAVDPASFRSGASSIFPGTDLRSRAIPAERSAAIASTSVSTRCAMR